MLQFLKYEVGRFKRFVRKERLERIIERNIPEKVRNSWIHGLEMVEFEFRGDALSYIWNVVEDVIHVYGIDSSEFEETAKELLSKREIALMKKNIEYGKNPRCGIALVKDRTYNLKEVIKLYERAKVCVSQLFSEKNIFETYQSDFVPYQNTIEKSPLYKIK